MGLDTDGYSFAAPELWAGRDPRAHPEATILAAAGRVITATAAVIGQLPGEGRESGRRRGEAAAVAAPTPVPARTRPQPGPAGREPRQDGFRLILADAYRFYLAAADGSWVPAYITGRGISPDIVALWKVGYAPASWTATIDHLRGLGHDVGAIEAAGLARRSSRGTLIDHFRDRVMFPVRDEDGKIVGFIGRARPQARPGTPKYLNSPQTELYRKGELLAGLPEGRSQLRRGAVPVLVEGIFDAMAIAAAGQGRYVGVAPCGTALTREQAGLLARAANLSQGRVVVALDGDHAGRKAAVRAYEILRQHVSMPAAVLLPSGADPASILQLQGGLALLAALRDTEPLAQTVIDSHLSEWKGRLDHPEGQLHAMRSAARVIVGGLPPEAAELIVRITAGLPQEILDEALRPVENPYLPAIARILPPAASCQAIRVAERTSRDCAEVVAEMVNAVIDRSRIAGGAGSRRAHGPAGLTAASFPRPRPASAVPQDRISGTSALRRSAPDPGAGPVVHGRHSGS
jgi:DNA primase